MYFSQKQIVIDNKFYQNIEFLFDTHDVKRYDTYTDNFLKDYHNLDIAKNEIDFSIYT